MSEHQTARQILEQPFDQSLVKQRPASYGGSLSYIEGHEYIKRLNQAFDGQWSFEITAHTIDENEVFVIGKLSADGVVKMAFGGSDIKRKKESGEIICLADDLKAAATDSLKKAATLLGLGLHLYGDTATVNAKPSNEDNGKATQGNGAPANGNGSAAPANGNGNGDGSRITSRQLSAILAIGRSKGLSRDQIAAKINERFGRQVEFLSKSEASWAIEEMTAA